MSSGQVFPDNLNPHCDLDLENSNPNLYAHDAPAPDDQMHHCSKSGCERFRSSGDNYGRKQMFFVGFFKELSPYLEDLDLEDTNTTFPHDTPGHGVTHHHINNNKR